MYSTTINESLWKRSRTLKTASRIKKLGLVRWRQN
jgi:hypothetical protein